MSRNFVFVLEVMRKIIYIWRKEVENSGTMCEICHRYRCPSVCPNYDGESAERGRPQRRCGYCGRYIYKDESYTRFAGKVFCEACREEYSVYVECLKKQI